MSSTTTHSFTSTETLSQTVTSLGATLTAFSFSDFTAITVACNAVCFVTGVSILMIRRYALQMLLLMGPAVPGLITMEAVYFAAESLGIFKATFAGIVTGVVQTILMWIIFFFVPFMGPSFFLSLLLMSSAFVLDVATLTHSSILEIIVPVFFAVLLVLVVYSIGKIPIVRSKEFRYPDSGSVKVLHVFLTCFAVGFALTTSLMFFIDGDRLNLMQLSHQQLTEGISVTADFSKKASIGLTSWLASSLIVGFTRSKWFALATGWLWSRIRNRKGRSQDTLGLIDNAALTEPSVTEFGMHADEIKQSTLSVASTNS